MQLATFSLIFQKVLDIIIWGHVSNFIIPFKKLHHTVKKIVQKWICYNKQVRKSALILTNLERVKGLIRENVYTPKVLYKMAYIILTERRLHVKEVERLQEKMDAYASKMTALTSIGRENKQRHDKLEERRKVVKKGEMN